MIPGSGILLVDKPAGVTSFSVVNHVRKSLVSAFPALNRSRRKSKGGHRPPRFKCGHAGTLDPMATGLLAVMVGRGSRISQFLLGLDKTYEATIRFGTSTDTLDREGAILEQDAVSITSAAVELVLPQFMGEIQQIPPLISALKVDGKALYKRVRSGENVPEPEARFVTINELTLQDIRWNVPSHDGLLSDQGGIHEVDLLVRCGSGTYIRSLARDIAAAAGTIGHLHALRRIDVGPFHVDNALTNVMNLDGDSIAEALQPLKSALPHVPLLALDCDEASGMRQGQQPRSEWLDRLDRQPQPIGKAGCLFRMVDDAEELVAIGILDEDSGLPRTAMVIPKDELISLADHEGKSVCD